MVSPAVLPNALSTGTGVVATGIQIPASVAAGNTLTAGIPSLMHASVPTLVTPVSVMSSVPVSVQGIPSPTVITYPTYVANTNPIIARPANAVLGRPAVPAVSIIGVVPTMPAAATYTATQPRSPFPNQQQLPYTQTVGYASVPAPQQTNLTQASVSPASMVMTVSDTANYPVATRFPVPVPEVQQEADGVKHRFYNGMEGPEAYAEKEPLSCLQESNVNHPTELSTRRGAMKRPAEDRELMPPPIVPVSSTTVDNKEEDKEKKTVPDESPEPERKKLKGALGGLASIYGSDDSDENDDDTPPSPTAKRK